MMLVTFFCIALTVALAPPTESSAVMAPTPWVVNDTEGNTCIIAQFNAEFSGTYLLGNGTVNDFSFPLPPSSEVDMTKSKCGNDTAVLVLTFDGDSFMLQFKVSEKMFYLSMVTATLMHDGAHFPGSNMSGHAITYGGTPGSPTFKGELGMSFRCISTETLQFMAHDFVITFQDLKLQPFGVENGTFSKEVPCDGDVVNPTDLYPSRWAVLDDKGALCILAQFEVVFDGEYTLKDNSTAMFHFAMPDNAVVHNTSMCGTAGKSNAVLVLMFDGGDTLTQEYKAYTKTKMFNLISAMANLTHTNAHFNDSKDEGMLVTYGGPTKIPLFETELGSFYKCSAEEKLTYKMDNFTLTYSDVMVQPFNVSGKFGNMNQCKADTPAIKPSVPPVGSWNVTDSKGVVCMRMSFSLNMIISYEMMNKTKSQAGFYLPVNNTGLTDGSMCLDNSAVFMLTFSPGPKKPAHDWVIKMKFTMVDGSNYAMTNFTVQYDLDQAHFPRINETIPVTTMKLENETKTFSTAKGSYYLCEAGNSIDTDGFDAIFGSVKIQPFAKGIAGGGYGNAADCTADNTVSNIVPIAVGCALAGLVIIVLIAYLIGRSRTNRSGYQSV